MKQDALAAGGEFGIFEGRTFALIHPIVLGGLFFYTLYAGYLGWQWRRVRTIQNDINELKKQLKPAPVTPDGKSLENSPPSPVELEIQKLTEVSGSRVHYCMLHESDEYLICWLLMIFRRGKSLSKVHTGINTLMLDPYF